MFSVVNDLLGKKSVSPILPDNTNEAAAETLSIFFKDKIETIRNSFGDCHSLPAADVNLFNGNPMTELIPVDEIQLRRYNATSKPTFCSEDPIPTRIMLDCFDILLPVLLNIVNGSLLSGTVPRPFKTAVIKPLLKKNDLDPNDCKNFRPVYKFC